MAAIFGAAQIDLFTDVQITIFAGVIGFLHAASKRKAVDRLNVYQRTVALLNSFGIIALVGKHAAHRTLGLRINLGCFQRGDGIANMNHIPNAYPHILHQTAIRCGDHLCGLRRNLPCQYGFSRCNGQSKRHPKRHAHADDSFHETDLLLFFGFITDLGIVEVLPVHIVLQYAKRTLSIQFIKFGIIGGVQGAYPFL